MPPQIIALVIAAIEAAIQDTPELVADLKAIFAKENPAPDDWKALRVKVLAKNYADYVPASALPAGNFTALPGVSAPSPVPSDAPQATPEASAPAETAAPAPNPPETTPTVPAAAAPVPAYLPDGSPNPAFNHLG